MSPLEVTPDHLKEKLISELSLVADKRESGFGIFTTFDDLLSKISNNQPWVAALSMIVVAIISSVIFKIEPIDDTMEFPSINKIRDKDRISEIIKSLNNNSNSTQSVKAKNQKGLSISVKNNILKIEQPLLVERDIYVFGNNKNIVLNEKVNDKKNSILLDNVVDNDSIRVIVKTEEIIVFDKWFNNTPK